jgi:nucleoside-diphosphate-sugar epimerase
MRDPTWIAQPEDLILITGAGGFIGSRVVEELLERGFRNLRCLVRPPGASKKLLSLADRWKGQARLDFCQGNLLSRADCLEATRDVVLVYHLAAGRADMIADAFMNSVVTTRNLLDAVAQHRKLKRFVNVSSFSVYSNRRKPRGRLLDEDCPMEEKPEDRGDAYTYGKVKQDEMILQYGKKLGIAYVIVRPGVVFGPGNESISNRVGIGTFGVFLHMGGSNPIPLTYVDNCADAIILAGLSSGVDGEIFNVVDDALPSSRRFLRLYKKNVRRFFSIYVPRTVSYFLCWLWEKYSAWSEEQLPPTFNRKGWHVFWKKTRYSNAKLKERLKWSQRVPSDEALRRFFESCRRKQQSA